MTEQPTALRLADDLDAEFVQGRISNHSGRKAATELRQQHATLQQSLAALEGVSHWVETRPDEHPWDAWQRVAPAIAALRERLGETK